MITKQEYKTLVNTFVTNYTRSNIDDIINDVYDDMMAMSPTDPSYVNAKLTYDALYDARDIIFGE